MSPRSQLALLAILLAFLALRLPPMLRQPGRIDEECYAVPGLTILRTGLPQLPHLPSRNVRSMFYRADEILYAEPPLYFYLQAALYAVLKPSYPTARLLSAAASVLILWRVFVLARRWSGSDAAGLWAAGLLGLSRWFHYAATIARPDIVCTLFGLLAIDCIDRWSASQHRRWLIAGGIMLGLGGLTHPLALVFALQCGVWVLWRANGWRKLTQSLALTAITLAVFALWLPLILRDPGLFWRQFDNQFVGHQNSGGSFLIWLSRPLASLWYHARFLWLNIGAYQFLLLLLPLIACSIRGSLQRDPGAAKAAWLTWSSILALSLMVGTHHDVPSYWAYPGAVGFLCTGIAIARLGSLLREKFTRTGTMLAAGLGSLLVLAMIPGSGARLCYEYVRHWNDANYNGPAFARQLLDEIPREAKVAVAGEYVLDFLADGRDVIGIANVPIYFDGEGLPMDFLVISRDTPPEAAARYCPEFQSAHGMQADPFACWAEVHRAGCP